MGTLPTDNLYKFICVLGVVFIVGSTTFLLRAIDQMDEYGAEYSEAIVQLQIATSRYFDKVNAAKTIIRKAGGLEHKGTPEQVAEVNKLLDDSDPLEVAANEAMLATQIPTSLFKMRLSRYETKRTAGAAGIVLGLIMFLAGLYLWYKRLQSKLDQKLA